MQITSLQKIQTPTSIPPTILKTHGWSRICLLTLGQHIELLSFSGIFIILNSSIRKQNNLVFGGMHKH